MRLISPDQMKQLDGLAQTDYGLEPEILMEAAGSLAAAEIYKRYSKEMVKDNTVIVCGPGNNGGDGLVVGRHLWSRGVKNLQVLVLQKTGSSCFEKQLDRAKAVGIPVKHIDEKSVSVVASSKIIIDGLFGGGISRPLTGDSGLVVDAVNKAQGKVIALDGPSGLCFDTGNVLGNAVIAHETLTFGLSKPGFYLKQGPKHAGRVRVVPIGLPPDLLKKAKSLQLFDKTSARKALWVRSPHAHKGSSGHLLVLAGRSGFWGAAGLVCQGANRFGAGYVTLAFKDAANISKPWIQEFGAEILTSHIGDPQLFNKKNAIVIGPGFGNDEETAKLLETIARKDIPAIVDADALSTLAEKEISPPSHWVLTPHMGEMGRLMGVDSQEIQQEPKQWVIKAAKKFGCVVLLKGNPTLIADPMGFVTIINSGNEALATAGSGDVLAGFMGASICQGHTPYQGACFSAYMHGLIADQWVTEKSVQGLLPRDLIERAPQVVKDLETSP